MLSTATQTEEHRDPQMTQIYQIPHSVKTTSTTVGFLQAIFNAVDTSLRRLDISYDDLLLIYCFDQSILIEDINGLSTGGYVYTFVTVATPPTSMQATNII